MRCEEGQAPEGPADRGGEPQAANTAQAEESFRLQLLKSDQLQLPTQPPAAHVTQSLGGGGVGSQFGLLAPVGPRCMVEFKPLFHATIIR